MAVGVAFTVAATATSVMTGGAAIAAPAEGSIRGAGGAGAIAGQYIVVFKEASTQAGNPAAAAKSLASRYGGSVGHTYSSALQGFSIKTSEAAAKKIAGDPSVAYVEQDGVAKASGGQATPAGLWGLDRIDQQNLPLNGKYIYPSLGSGVYAYIIDTGIRTSHNDFGGRAVWGTNTTGDGNNTDCNGHGTHVAGTVGGGSYGVAKAVKLVAVKVLGCSGSGSWSGVIAGVDWAKNNAVGKKAVANMSLGGSFNSSVNTAVTNLINSGVTTAVAAGNSDANACNFSPASTPSAITVGATNNADTRASFSNFGGCLDLFAPGVNVLSAWHTADNATNTISGTSMASPHVAGAAALFKAMHPGFTPAQIRNSIVWNAGVNKVVDEAGSPDLLLYIGLYGMFGNGTNMNIPDNGSVISTVAVAGLVHPDAGAKASAHAKVFVSITHTFRGDLRIYLVAPDGTLYLLKWNDPTDMMPNIYATYTVNLMNEGKNGNWRLLVQDVATGDTGFLDHWGIWV